MNAFEYMDKQKKCPCDEYNFCGKKHCCCFEPEMKITNCEPKCDVCKQKCCECCCPKPCCECCCKKDHCEPRQIEACCPKCPPCPKCPVCKECYEIREYHENFIRCGCFERKEKYELCEKNGEKIHCYEDKCDKHDDKCDKRD